MKGEKVYRSDAGLDIPEPHFPTYEELERLGNGDREVVNHLVEALVEYAMRETDWFVHTVPAARPFKEDLASESLLALTETVNNLLGTPRTPVQLVSYIKQAIYTSHVNWLNDYGQGPVRIPATSRRRGESLQFVDLSDSIEYHDPGQNDLIFEDYVESLPIECQEVLRMKLHGCSNREIGQELNVDPRQVNTILRKILSAFWDEV